MLCSKAPPSFDTKTFNHILHLYYTNATLIFGQAHVVPKTPILFILTIGRSPEKLAKYFSIRLTVPFGRFIDERIYVGRDYRICLIRVIFPPRDRILPCHLLRLLTILANMPSKRLMLFLPW